MRSLRCLLGVHAWRIERTVDGEDYQRCSRCHRDRSGAVEEPVKDAYGRAKNFFGGSM